MICGDCGPIFNNIEQNHKILLDGLPKRTTAGQFSVKLLFKNFPVVILCIGIILVFQNIIHGGW